MSETKPSTLTRVFLTLFFAASLSLAQGATVRINPTKIRLIVPPGVSKSGEIEIDNPSEDSVIVKSYLEDWAYTALHDGTKSFFPANTLSLSCSNWITTSLGEFVVLPFGKQIVHYTIKVPEGSQGGHYSALFFESLLSKPEFRETAQLGVVVRIGALFYIEAEGATRREAAISDFSLKKESDTLPLEVGAELTNTGNVDITSAGTFHIMDKQGMIYARGELDKLYLFPQEKGRLSGKWEKRLAKGRYSLVLTLDIGKALEEAQLGRGPVIIKEAQIEIGDKGEVLRTGELK